MQATVADLEANVPVAESGDPDLSASIGIYLQARLALAGYVHGLTISADLQGSSLDTHTNHDAEHPLALDRFFAAFDYLLRCATYLGVQDKILIYVKSDFGRSPFYNNDKGKDHFPVTSVMFMGTGITGNRVIGGTDDTFNALKVNLQTLKLDDGGTYI